MIAFSALAISQLEGIYDGLSLTTNSKIAWVDGAKKRVHNAVISGSYTVTIIPGLTVSCDVEKNDTALTVKSIGIV